MNPPIGFPDGRTLTNTCSGPPGQRRANKGICQLRVHVTKGGKTNPATGDVPCKIPMALLVSRLLDSGADVDAVLPVPGV